MSLGLRQGTPAACQFVTAPAILLRGRTWAIVIKAPVQPGRQLAHHLGVQAVHLWQVRQGRNVCLSALSWHVQGCILLAVLQCKFYADQKANAAPPTQRGLTLSTGTSEYRPCRAAAVGQVGQALMPRREAGPSAAPSSVPAAAGRLVGLLLVVVLVRKGTMCCAMGPATGSSADAPAPRSAAGAEVLCRAAPRSLPLVALQRGVGARLQKPRAPCRCPPLEETLPLSG